jgi:hypothetical protein
MSQERLELEPTPGEFKPRRDDRRHMPVPPPVRLVAVEDVHVPAAAGREIELDRFYLELLRFERDGAAEARAGFGIVYRAENFRLWFDVQEPPVQRDDFRAAMIEVPELARVQKQLIEREYEFERQRGLTPANDQLVMLDPAGNWISVGEMREFR